MGARELELVKVPAHTRGAQRFVFCFFSKLHCLFENRSPGDTPGRSNSFARPRQARITARFIPGVKLPANSLEVGAGIMIFLDYREER